MTRKNTQARPSESSFRGPAGATLVELLAVIIIMTMLAAAALPVIAPAMQNRQVREAARIVNGFLTGARNRAMQTGRPVGVVLERMQGLPEACVTLAYAEVPPPYAGDSLTSYVEFGGGGIHALTPIKDPMTGALLGSADIGWIGTVRVGDLIKFNYIGYTFQITGVVDTSSGTPVPVPPDAQGYLTAAASPSLTCIWQLAPTSANATVPSVGTPKYQIFRAPIRMAAGSVQLPGTTVIDLTCSGFDYPTPLAYVYPDPMTGAPITVPFDPPGVSWMSSQTFQPLPQSIGGSQTFTSGGMDTSSVVLTFNPSGTVDRLWCWQSGSFAPAGGAAGQNSVPTPMRPTQAMHLMVGQREYLPLPAAPPAITDPTFNGFKPFLNWQDVGNFWVTINPQSGLVTTTEVLQSTFNVVPGTPPQYGQYGDLLGSRKLAREAISMGGR